MSSNVTTLSESDDEALDLAKIPLTVTTSNCGNVIGLWESSRPGISRFSLSSVELRNHRPLRHASRCRPLSFASAAR